MKWKKLIDEKPDTWHLKPVRFIHTKMMIMDIEKLLSERPNSLPSIVEWLDESITKGDRNALEILKEHLKPHWMFGGESEKAVLAAMEEYAALRSQPKGSGQGEFEKMAREAMQVEIKSNKEYERYCHELEKMLLPDQIELAYQLSKQSKL